MKDQLPVVAPFDAREAALRYLTESHSDRTSLAQHQCINRAFQTPATTAPSTPSSSNSLSLHPVYTNSGITARGLNVELMSELESVLAEIQSTMEEKLAHSLIRWTQQQSQSFVAETPRSTNSSVSPGAPLNQSAHQLMQGDNLHQPGFARGLFDVSPTRQLAQYHAAGPAPRSQSTSMAAAANRTFGYTTPKNLKSPLGPSSSVQKNANSLAVLATPPPAFGSSRHHRSQSLSINEAARAPLPITLSMS